MKTTADTYRSLLHAKCSPEHFMVITISKPHNNLIRLVTIIIAISKMRKWIYREVK